MANPVNFKTFPGSMVLVVLCTAAMVSGCKGKSNTVALPDTPAPAAVPQTSASPQGFTPSSSTKTLLFNWSAISNASYYRLLENANGISGYSQKGGDLTSTNFSFGIAAHFYDWPDAKYMLEACNNRGCSQSGEVTVASVMLGAIGYFKPDSTPANINNYYGWSQAISADGNTLAVGVPFDDSSATGINGILTGTQITNSGAVYVYRRNGSSWQKEAYIKA
ncbi:MAG TPA: hypothetical protein VFY78_06250, partial [Gammaproteobacteria bacterium]|nr:hypothetical protein [Gammaproteobacteria bacterium]